MDLKAIDDGLTRGEFFLEYLPTISLGDGRCVGKNPEPYSCADHSHSS